MENITLFVSIVIIIFGVLQILLFFKLWEMTNDVKKISLKQPPSKEDELIDEAQLLCLDGEKEKAFKCYKQAFFISISELYNNISLKYNIALKEDRKDIYVPCCNGDYIRGERRKADACNSMGDTGRTSLQRYVRLYSGYNTA